MRVYGLTLTPIICEGDPFPPQDTEHWHSSIGMWKTFWCPNHKYCIQAITWLFAVRWDRAFEEDAEGHLVHQKLSPKGHDQSVGLLKSKESSYTVLTPNSQMGRRQCETCKFWNNSGWTCPNQCEKAKTKSLKIFCMLLYNRRMWRHHDVIHLYCMSMVWNTDQSFLTNCHQFDL